MKETLKTIDQNEINKRYYKSLELNRGGIWSNLYILGPLLIGLGFYGVWSEGDWPAGIWTLFGLYIIYSAFVKRGTLRDETEQFHTVTKNKFRRD